MTDDQDHERRIHALTLAAQTQSQVPDILTTATTFLGWLRRPAPPATLTLRAATPIEK